MKHKATVSIVLAVISLQQLNCQPQGCKTISGEMLQLADQKSLTLTTRDRTILHWQSFSNDPKEITRFAQPSAHSIVLNRVVGKQMSSLLGTLESNGHVYLINPNGILIGKGAVIDCAAFLASTLDVNNDLFLQNKQLLFQGDSKATITNLGTIQARTGAVHLLGYTIENSGSITASQEVGLLAGNHILLQPEKSQLLYIASNNPNVKQQIQADGPHRLGINTQGAITALSIQGSNGRILLKASDSDVQLAGSVSGGIIEAQGHAVTIAKQSELKANRIAIETGGGILYNEGTLTAEGGQIDLKVAYNDSDPKPLYQLGILDVSGTHTGKITIAAPKYYNHGFLFAKNPQGKGGNVSIHTQGCYQESTSGVIDVNGWIGGTISIEVDDGHLFTSGTHKAVDGRIIHLAPHVALVAATLDVGTTGKLQVGNAKTNKITLNPFTTLSTMLGADPSVILQSDQLIDPNAGNGFDFGFRIVPLSTGNVVVAKDQDDFGGAGAGAVYLFNGATSALISTLTGSNAGDAVGTAVTALTGNGNFVTFTSLWNASTGAATFGSGVTGRAGIVSAANSLVGDVPGDAISQAVVPLTNGNYVIRSEFWNAITGAATFGSGATGVMGTINSATNSLVGSVPNDSVAQNGVHALPNGNYVVLSPFWSGNTGAITWGNGTSGTMGTINSLTNSTVGANGGDQVGSDQIAILQGPNSGNFVVGSQLMQNPGLIGKVVWFSGTGPSTGTLQAANGIQGTGNDRVGVSVTALTNGNYVVGSPLWDLQRGAATWADGSGRPGANVIVGVTNSITGPVGLDQVADGITALTNGNFVIRSENFNGTNGAITWGNGSNGTNMLGLFGDISVADSLVGSIPTDLLFSVIRALTNGNFVLSANNWNTGTGAATWGNGMTGINGVISAANSLVGSNPGDQVGARGVTVLANGDYVVPSPAWNITTGAATWGNGSGGTVGTISAANSLVGSIPGDSVGVPIALSNGNYVVVSFLWNNGAATTVGAVTWEDSLGSIVGPVTTGNSIVGTTTGDMIGDLGILELSNGDFIFGSSTWTNTISSGGPFGSAGAVTIASSTGTTTGTITTDNSLIGLSATGGFTTMADDTVNKKFYGGWFTEQAPTAAIGPSGIVRWGQYAVVPTPTPTPAVVANIISGRAKYATAMSETFGLWTDLKWGQYFNIDRYPPMYTPKSLNQTMFSLILPEQPTKIKLAKKRIKRS